MPSRKLPGLGQLEKTGGTDSAHFTQGQLIVVCLNIRHGVLFGLLLLLNISLLLYDLSSKYHHIMAIHRIITDPAALVIVATLLFLVYLIYQRFWHPLAKYPGPFLATWTDFHKFSLFWSLRIDQRIGSLHQKYGPIVRIAPNELSFWNAEAVAPIYKSGKAMAKSPFFDGFTTFNPNLFGNRDEKVRFRQNRYFHRNFLT